jgi:hypothetical protein
MGRPEITDDQREIAIEMLANALRKDAHLRARASRLRQHEDAVRYTMARRRSEPSQRYVDGMRDLLKVLFVDGHVAAEEILEEAYRRAIGAPPGNPNGTGGARYH